MLSTLSMLLVLVSYTHNFRLVITAGHKHLVARAVRHLPMKLIGESDRGDEKPSMPGCGCPTLSDISTALSLEPLVTSTSLFGLYVICQSSRSEKCSEIRESHRFVRAGVPQLYSMVMAAGEGKAIERGSKHDRKGNERGSQRHTELTTPS